MAKLKKRALRIVRNRIGRKTQFERRLRQIVNRQRLRSNGFMIRTDACVVDGSGESRIGVYAYGGCDLDAIVSAGHYLRGKVLGPTAIRHVGHISTGRSDFILQNLESPPAETHVAEVTQVLELPQDQFAARLFEPRFTVTDHEDLGEFDKTVVVLSIGPDMVRTLYLHREHGYLLDPGGFWLGSDLQKVLGDLRKVRWFAENFKKIGRIELEDSMTNFERIIKLVRGRFGAEVMVANALVVDPGITTFDYRISHSPHTARRREFVLGLVELSRRLNFPILDVDSLMKGHGVTGMGDFVHYTPEQKLIIGRHTAETLLNSRLIPSNAAAGS